MIDGVPIMKCIVFSITAAFAFAVVSPANASVLAWTLEDVKFSDGATASGSFTTDSTNGYVLTYDIATSAGTSGSAYHYDATGSHFGANNFFAPNSFLIVANNAPGTFLIRDLVLAFQSSLTVRGTDNLNLNFGGSHEDLAPGYRSVISGAATTVAEPATWSLMIVGFGLVGGLVRARSAINSRHVVA